MAGRTPSQTVGPFFSEALRWKDGGKVRLAGEGESVVLVGRITDGAGAPVADALVETWQAFPEGPAVAEGNPRGFARVETGPDGMFRIETRMPPGKAPCLDVTLFARGLLRALRTRVYFAPESAVRSDPLLASIASSPRVATLVARREGAEYRWNVRLQGEGETVFFAA
ncbi:MAG: protocatechuate 3,4-dioxygenase subunit alpha [Usitatibacter sp.]